MIGRIAILSAVLWSAGPAGAAVDASALVAELDRTEYVRILDELLHTHDGDNRGFSWYSSQGRYLPAGEHDAARDNILDYFSAQGLAAGLDPFTEGSYTGCNNVLAWLPGRIHPDRVYVIGGHYDSVQNPGADDNASGVAGVMEAARVLANQPLAATVLFAAWDLEEKGLHGSHHWVDTEDESVVDGVVNLDMIAYNHNAADTAALYGSAGWVSKWQAAAGRYAPSLTINTDVLYLPYSDHWPFQAAGRPAGGIIENTADLPLPNPYYHKQADSFDTSDYLDFDYAIDLLSTAVGFLAEEADWLLPGDADNDKFVGREDLIVLEANLGMTSGASWLDGDFDADGDVGANDYATLKANWGAALPTTVPEPAALALLAVCGLLPGRRRGPSIRRV